MPTHTLSKANPQKTTAKTRMSSSFARIVDDDGGIVVVVFVFVFVECGVEETVLDDSVSGVFLVDDDDKSTVCGNTVCPPFLVGWFVVVWPFIIMSEEEDDQVGEAVRGGSLSSALLTDGFLRR